MMSSTPTSAATAAFIERWKTSGGAERANYQLFLSELCEIIEVPKPQPMTPDPEANQYVFEKPVTFHHPDNTTSTGRIDLYKRGCFVLEAKQGVEKLDSTATLTGIKKKYKTGTATRGTRSWHDAMLSARGQAEQYAKALPEWPPFISVVDVGHVIELYSDFERQGKTYLPFPGPRDHRIYLPDLAQERCRERLHYVWTDPFSLDPSKKQAEVTREVAVHLAKLARVLEQGGNDPKLVAEFLSRCLFTMFSEDVGMLPPESFTQLLEKHRDRPDVLGKLLASLWHDMNDGGFSTVITENVLRFNGGLFADQSVITLTTEQVDLLTSAAHADWSNVEPSIFGTLLERALDPKERHKLGAHFTPREYVERLVMPTVIEPLRKEWDAVKAASISLERQVDPDDPKTDKYRKEAVKSLTAFHDKLCNTRVLDPACGSGNFLYVTFEHMKRLEGEVLQALADHGETEQKFELLGATVDPHQFLGIEINPRAAAIADMVLWLGYLKWHFRTHGKVNPPEPVLRDFKNIECRDAVLAWDDVIPLVDAAGEEVTQWDGDTYKKHNVTGDDVPDETARQKVWKYVNPRKAEWPEADYVVSNPPFVGNKRMRTVLGDGYVSTIRELYSEVPSSVDYVMYWWSKAAEFLRDGNVIRFGLITTNSITQTYCQEMLRSFISRDSALSLVFAVPDHPWVDSESSAAVRIAMTVVVKHASKGTLLTVSDNNHIDDLQAVPITSRTGIINTNLSIGAETANVTTLRSNSSLGFRGITLVGEGFIIDPTDELASSSVARRLVGAKALIGKGLELVVLDLYSTTESEVRERHPKEYQHLYNHVRPFRQPEKRQKYAKDWWIFARPRGEFRSSCIGLNRYIATVETSRHRWFRFIDSSSLPEQTIVSITLSDAYHLGILSSKIHISWSKALGARLGVGNDLRYTIAQCFDTFPFPATTTSVVNRIRSFAESIEMHRNNRILAHESLNMTDIYNVIEKLRREQPLTAKEIDVHDMGLCSVLLQLHDDLDKAVFDAYGWPSTLTDEEILERLVALNAERAEEEKRGIIRWLRPEFQAPKDKKAEQGSLGGAVKTKATKKKAGPKAKKSWPKELVGRVQAVQSALDAATAPSTASEIAKAFARARKQDVEQILATLASLGQVQRIPEGRYTS